MTNWKEVTKRAKDEAEKAAHFAESRPATIEKFYPEIRCEGALEYTNTVGELLLPDLLTSEGVIVDLYDWRSPDKLIDTYGVDLEFLLELWEHEAVVLCANLDVNRYEGCEWLYPLLADDRTIYRSIRTPTFFESISPGFGQRRRNTEEEDLPRAFNRLGQDEINRMIEACKAAKLPNNTAKLCTVLSHWIERLSVFDGDMAKEIKRGIELGDLGSMKQLRRAHRLIVSPHSAYLGGEMKVLEAKWADLFESDETEAETTADFIRYKEILSWLSEQTLGGTANDFDASIWWKQHVQGGKQRNAMLDILTNVEERRKMLEAEEILRIGLAKNKGQLPNRDDVKNYVNEAEQLRRKTAIAIPLLPAALTAGFSILSQNSFLTAALIGGGTAFASETVLNPTLWKVAELIMPKVRLARLIEGRTG